MASERCPGSGMIVPTEIRQRTVVCWKCGQTVACTPVMGLMVAHDWNGITPLLEIFRWRADGCE